MSVGSMVEGDARCPHGLPVGMRKEITFAGGVGTCTCCKNVFGTFSNRRTLCDVCARPRS